MDEKQWERTRIALETELVAKAHELADHLGSAHGFTVQVQLAHPPLFLCFGEAAYIRRDLPDTNTGFGTIV